MANEKKPEGQSSELVSAPDRPTTSKRPAVGEVERPVKRTGAVPKWSTGPISGLDEETAAQEKSAVKRPLSGKQPAVAPPAEPEKAPPKRQSVPSIKQPVLGAGAEKSVAKRPSARAGVLPPPPVPSTQPAVELADPSASTLSLPSPFAAPKPPAAFVPDDTPAKTSTDVPVCLPDPPAPASPFALPKPPAGYRPDDEESERTSTADAVPVAPEPPPPAAAAPTPPPSTGKKPAAQPPSENRDGSTVLKRADEIRDPDQPELSVAKAFQSQKPPPPVVEFEEVKTTLKPIADDDDEPTSKPAPPRVADEKTNIKDLAELAPEKSKSPFDSRTALVPTRATGEIKKTAAAEQRLKEKEGKDKDGKGALEDKTRMLPLPDDETTSGAAARPGETLPPDAPAVGADGKPLDPKLAGAFSRAKEPGKEPMGKVTGTIKPPLTRDQRLALGVVAGGAALILLILVASLGSFKDRPTAEDLERCYPYGQNGANGPNGLRAPAVALVKFKFDQELDVPVSTEFEKCVVVKYEGPGANATTPFQGSMVMCKRWDKIWNRGNDDGMPFRIAE